MAGVIAFKRLHRFEIALWRACHAKVFVKHAPVMTPLEDPSVSGNDNTSLQMMSLIII